VDSSLEGPGPLLLVADESDAESGWEAPLLEAVGARVLVLPTAAAYEHPERAVATAEARFGGPGSVEACYVLRRADAENPSLAEKVGAARALYLCGASPLHLRSVLKDSLVLQALLAAWRSGAAVIGANGAATALSDPMVDPRGGAFTVGLGLVRDLATVCGAELDEAQLRRTLALAPPACAVIALGVGAALRREPDGTWRREGRGELAVYVEGRPAGLDALAGKALHAAVAPHPGTPAT
jgi:cyanophycinase